MTATWDRRYSRCAQCAQANDERDECDAALVEQAIVEGSTPGRQAVDRLASSFGAPVGPYASTRRRLRSGNAGRLAARAGSGGGGSGGSGGSTGKSAQSTEEHLLTPFIACTLGGGA